MKKLSATQKARNRANAYADRNQGCAIQGMRKANAYLYNAYMEGYWSGRKAVRDETRKAAK